MKFPIAKVVKIIGTLVAGLLLEEGIKEGPKWSQILNRKMNERKKNAENYIKIISKVAMADGLLSNNEIGLILKNLPEKLYIKKMEIEKIIRAENLKETPISELTKTIVTKELAKQVIITAIKVAYSDSDCSNEELTIIKEVSKCLKISNEELDKYISENRINRP